MSNLLDYLDWRGDLTFDQSPFNEVDSLILSELSYLNFKNIVPAPELSNGLSVCEAAKAYFANKSPKRKHIVTLDEQIETMLEKMAQTPRFSNMHLNCYTEHVDMENAEQFSAITFETDKRHIYCAFRGTDDTLAGWQEDLELSCTAEVPSQKRAVQYLVTVAKQYPRYKIMLGGHSKGGNLAVYAAIFVPQRLQKRITDIWSNDGPGFHNYILDLPSYKRLESRIHTIIPRSSVVGMLLEHGEKYTVVDSDELGLLQHNALSWQVMGDHFITLPDINETAMNSSLAVREWLHNVSVKQRKDFIDALFSVLNASGAKTLTDLKTEKIRAIIPMAKAMMNVDKEVRNGLLNFVQLLLTHSTRMMIESLQQEVRKKSKFTHTSKKDE